jgi:transposase
VGRPPHGAQRRPLAAEHRRDLPERYGRRQTVYHRFNAWRQSGLLDRLPERLQVRLDEAGLIETDLWYIDGTSVRATRGAAGARKKSAR